MKTEIIERCSGIGTIVYEKDGIQREWCIGALYGKDTVGTLRAHLEKWIPGARLLSADIRPVDTNTDAYAAELAALKSTAEDLECLLGEAQVENERLRRGLVCPICGGRDFHNTDTGLGLEHKDGRLFCSSECLVRAIRDEHEAALDQEVTVNPCRP